MRSHVALNLCCIVGVRAPSACVGRLRDRGRALLLPLIACRPSVVLVDDADVLFGVREENDADDMGVRVRPRCLREHRN